MFNPDFYPTPDHVIELMVSPLDLDNKIVLEPSAGKGNIVDYLNRSGVKQVLTYEKEKSLVEILKSKSKVLGNNFLESKKEELSHIDYIIMNPPFSADERHILHAYEVCPPGCTVISLCNHSIIEGRNRSQRELKSIIKNFGFSQYLGDCFSNAERSTGVEVSMISLFKPKTGEDEFEGYFDENEELEDASVEGIMPYNEIRSIVQKYVGAIKLYDEVLENAVKMNSMLKGYNYHKLTFTCSNDEKPLKRSEFKKELQKKSWWKVFNSMNMSRFVTSSVMADINRFVEKQENIPFTMSNVYKMIGIIVGTRENTMNKVYIDVFDKITYHYSENRHNVEGWKTNSHYMVGKKFILNNCIELGYHNDMKVKHNSQAERLKDFNKALSFLTGEPGAEESLENIVGGRRTNESRGGTYLYEGHKEFGQWFDWGFFECKGYKKGTLHCKFKDDKVWELFNRKVAEIKGYPLPDAI